MQILLAVISVCLIATVFISLIRKDFWVYKVLEYPRLQKLVIIAIVTACWLFFWPLQETVYKVIFSGLILSIIYLFYKIWPYTALSKKEMISVRSMDPENEFKIFSANVLQENTQYATMLEHIKSTDPDIIFLLETNSAWFDATKDLKKDYPHTILAPLENTYGLLFYSRLELENAKIVYRVKTDIPSIEAILVLPSGQKVQLWGLHPEPPVPGETLYSTAKDKELMKVAIIAKECKLPCIVFGDLNDVAWSYTTELFRKTSNLLDPRRGRGFYSTFSAHHWFIRFPLDYIFCSKEFSLIHMKRLPKNGSDHFATITHLALRIDLVRKQDPPEADSEELHEARKIADQPVKE
jgi:endonuclease/exonuclease/phosphatase (EEP) superfamily protein YafD